MIKGSIARRYARALFDLAVEQDRVERWSVALTTLEQAVESSAELREALANPVYTREQRRAIAAKLAELLQLDPEPAHLLDLLAERNRLSCFGAIVEIFAELTDKKLGRIRAKVISAVALDPAAATRLAQTLTQVTQAEVIVDHQVDAGLIGGLVAKVGSIVYDGSVRTQLEELRRKLKN
jgi:F-type H+-transporting ATPase subunit delta